MALLLPSLDGLWKEKDSPLRAKYCMTFIEMFPFPPLCKTNSTKYNCSFSLLTKELKDQWEIKIGKGKTAQSSE